MLKFNQYTINESKSEMDILNAITYVLELEKKPLSMVEIWSKISELGLLPKSEFDRINNATKSGKIVGIYSGYLDTLLSRSSINTKRADSNKKNLFEIVGSRPNMKYKLVGKNEEDKLIDAKKYTFVEAAQLILKQNDNKPMTALEIWEEANSHNLVETLGKTPKATMNAQMIVYSDNTTAIGKKKNSIFRIIEDKPYKFILLNPNDEVQSVPDDESKHGEYYLLGAYDGTIGAGQKSELWKTYVDGGYWLNGFAVAGVDKLKEEVNNIPVGANVAIKSSYVRGKVNPVIMIKARGVVTKNYGDGTKIDVDWEKGFKPFEIIRNDVGGYRQTLHDITDKQEHIDLIWNNEEVSDKILSPSEFIKSPEKPKVYVKNPFGCKDEDGEQTSTLCIIGKSGSGKTTSTEIALEEMKHEYLLYIPIEGEYTFSQYTGKDFEMSSLGEFMMMAQNDPSKCYTIIFDECHRPITISKLNTDLLQALSSRRNRGGERFVTMDRSTKRMYTSSTDEFPINLKAVSGKVLVPDNFGIVCLSSNPSVICRNDDFLNRVDLVVFHESDRGITDLTELKKLEPSEKNIESIRGLLLSDGKQ